MEEYIPDGELHAISKDYAYALKYFLDKNSVEKNCENMTELQLDFAKKYAEYLLEFNKEKVMSILMEKMMQGWDEDLQFIFRPAYIVSSLTQNASFAMKFKRALNDNLKVKDV
jgi:hypothetical protein